MRTPVYHLKRVPVRQHRQAVPAQERPERPDRQQVRQQRPEVPARVQRHRQRGAVVRTPQRP